MAKAEEFNDIKVYDRAMKKISSGKAEFVSLEEVLKNMPKPKH